VSISNNDWKGMIIVNGTAFFFHIIEMEMSYEKYSHEEIMVRGFVVGRRDAANWQKGPEEKPKEITDGSIVDDNRLLP
jgi:hypothetical protein